MSTSPTLETTIVTHETVESNNQSGINYKTVIDTFGCQMMTTEILDMVKAVTKQSNLHPFLENDIFFAHRDFDKLMSNCLKQKRNDFYIYTGRGPSTSNLHLGHLIPFMFAKYLQDIFDVPVIIQITDDEKYYHSKNDSAKLIDFQQYAIENIKDIIACQFNPNKTFIFLNSTYSSYMNHNLAKIQKHINLNHIKSVFGYNENDNMGRISFPVHQMVPSFATSFPNLLSNDPIFNTLSPSDILFNQLENPKEYQNKLSQLKNMRCLIVAAIDQDPYFRILRDVASKMKEHKPSIIYSKFLASLLGKTNKMSSSIDKSSIFLSDTPQQINKKIKSFAFSGGQETSELHKQFGGNPDIDVAFQYIQFFSTSSDMVSQIRENYIKGLLSTGELKQICINLLTNLIATHQNNKSTITNEIIKQFLQPRYINQVFHINNP